MAFGNELLSTPTAFRNEYHYAYFFFIVCSKRAISIGIEQKKNYESFETTRLNLKGTFTSRGMDARPCVHWDFKQW